MARAAERLNNLPDDATKASAEILKIESDLQTELDGIAQKSRIRTVEEINQRLAALELAKTEELAKFGTTEQAKIAIEQKFSTEQQNLLLEQANIQKEIWRLIWKLPNKRKLRRPKLLV